MSELDGEIIEANDVATIADLGALATKPRKLDDNTAYALLDSDGNVRIERTDFAKPRPLPDHITAGRTVATPESFIDYVTRHHGSATEVFANLVQSSVIGIIDSHEASTSESEIRAGWNEHKVTLMLEKTPAWLAWAAHDGRWLDQLAFAEHIEDNLSDVIEPDAATFLEIAQSFQATNGVEFKSSQRLSTGETKFTYAEKTDAKAGQSGDLSIPDRFVIGVTPYVGGTAYRMSARFKYRLRAGELSLSYKLDRPEVVLEDAFKDILTTIGTGLDGTAVPIFHGRP